MEERKLTKKEKDVLAVLVNPDYFGKTNEEKIAAIGVNRAHFYKIMRDPFFREKEREAFYDMLREHVGPILNASIETAKLADRDGFNDRKMLMEMARMYDPTRRVDVTSKGESVKGYTVVSPDDWNDDATGGSVPPAPVADSPVAGQEPDPPADG